VDDPKYQLSAEARCRRILEALAGELTPARAPWFKPDWLASTVRNAPLALDRAADRWRHLYRSAREQREQQDRVVADHLRTSEERRTAQALRAEAEAQIELLTSSRQGVYSDFYRALPQSVGSCDCGHRRTADGAHHSIEGPRCRGAVEVVVDATVRRARRGCAADRAWRGRSPDA
jgi:hypothetical protein